MKCVKKGKNISRVSDRRAQELVREEGWSYCPKGEWKKKVRDVSKPKKEKKAEKVEKTEGE